MIGSRGNVPKDIPIFDLDIPRTRSMLIELIKTRRGLWWLDFKRSRKQRSLKQNAWYWAELVPSVTAGIKEQWGETLTDDETHELLKRMFLSRPIVDHNTGEEKGRIVGSSVELDTAEFTKYAERVMRFAAELGVYAHAPHEMAVH